MKLLRGVCVNRNTVLALTAKGDVMLKVDSKKLETVAVLNLEGQIVNGETDILRKAVQSLSGASAVVLNLARVTAVDAGGLGVMLELRQQAEAKGIRFELMNVTEWVGRVLEITRLNTVFRITSKLELFPAVSRRRRTAVGRPASRARGQWSVAGGR